MHVAERSRVLRAVIVPVAGVVVLGALLSACASATRQFSPVALDNPDVAFSNGRVTLFLTDENGLPVNRATVNFAWESPQFHKTTALTDNNGEVTFNGVPEVAEVSIDHPGGNYTRTLVVPQRGASELRLILETYGENQATWTRQRTPVELWQRSQ